MFGLFKKKPAASDQRQADAPQANKVVKESAKRKFDEQDFEAILRAHFRPGNFSAFYFAKCCGIRGDTLSGQNTGDFVQAVLQRDPRYIDFEGKKLGFAHFEKEVVTSLGSAYMEMMWSIVPTEGEELRIPRSDLERLRVLQKYFSENGIKKLGTVFPDTDLVEKVFQHVETLRGNDLELLLFEIEKRSDIIKKIFRPLRNSRVNKYGDEDYGPEYNEIEKLIDYAFAEDDFRFFWHVKPLSTLLGYIEGMLDEGMPANEMPVDGIDFEHWCADRLREQGWEVVVSRATGDQGVDVMARRDGIEVAIQCKRYTNPIGNKAVQEAFTGAQNEDAGHSCVIGTGGFTPSARQIASKTGVELIDAAEIGSFSSLFGFEAMGNAEATNDLGQGS